MTDDGRLDMIHRLRALTVQLDLLGAEFAQKHALHPTDLRALIGLLDRERAGEIATPGWLAERSAVRALQGRPITRRWHGAPSPALMPRPHCARPNPPPLSASGFAHRSKSVGRRQRYAR